MNDMQYKFYFNNKYEITDYFALFYIFSFPKSQTNQS